MYMYMYICVMTFMCCTHLSTDAQTHEHTREDACGLILHMLSRLGGGRMEEVKGREEEEEWEKR